MIGRLPRWRCADSTCWASKWQVVRVLGEYDPVDVALGELERHWRKAHKDKNDEEESA